MKLASIVLASLALATAIAPSIAGSALPAS